MNKKTLWLSVVMLVIPEVLWAPMFNFIFFNEIPPRYGFIQPYIANPLVSKSLGKLLVIIQSVGVIIALNQLLKLKPKKYLFSYRLAILVLFILLIILFYI